MEMGCDAISRLVQPRWDGRSLERVETGGGAERKTSTMAARKEHGQTKGAPMIPSQCPPADDVTPWSFGLDNVGEPEAARGRHDWSGCALDSLYAVVRVKGRGRAVVRDTTVAMCCSALL